MLWPVILVIRNDTGSERILPKPFTAQDKCHGLILPVSRGRFGTFGDLVLAEKQ